MQNFDIKIRPMSELQFRTGTDFSFDNVFSLYDSVGWTAYTSDKLMLEQAIKNSLFVLTAWKEQKLVGLLRAVGDGLTIIYVQDILVEPNFRRQHIGRQLLTQLLDEYSSVRQIVLMTDNTYDTVSFYERCGLAKTENMQLQTFVRLKANSQ